MFVFINLIGQLGGVAMVLLRLKVDIACGILFGIVFLQVRKEGYFFPMSFSVKSLSSLSDDRLQHFVGRPVPL